MNTHTGKVQTRKSLVIGFGKLIACLGLVAFDFANKAAADGPWDSNAQFSSIQGTNSWYYQQRPQGATSPLVNMLFSDGTYRNTGYPASSAGWLYADQGHPGQSLDVIRKWVAPSSGTVSIIGHVYKINTAAGAGIIASVEKNGTSIWSRTVAYNDPNGYGTDCDLGAVSVNSGDSIAFIVDDNGVYSADWFHWAPVITKKTTYDAAAQLTSTQGSNGWYYQQRPQGATSPVINMTFPNGDIVWRTTDYPSGNYGWMGLYLGINGHPGASLDLIRKWVAPSSGTVSITGRVYKAETGGGSGLIASVEQNGTSIWSKTVAYNDAIGYNTDSDLGAVSVNSGDSIAFIIDDNGNYSYSSFDWSPVINLISSTASSWALNTSDTLMTLSIVGNQPAITNLEDAATLYNWVPNPITVPLLTTVYEGGTQYNPSWSYTSATVDTSSGKKVTLTFTSTTPSLTLAQVWWAHPGAGPVEETTSVTNNSGTAMTYQDVDVIPADLTVTSDANATLWRFYRIHVGPTTGVTTTALGAGASVTSTASNDLNSDSDSNGTYILPFIMLDSPGAGATPQHGLYIGYWSDFANIKVSTDSGNAHLIESKFSLFSSGSVTDGASTPIGTVFPFPTVCYGTYKGDTDDGSNKMKKWFWTYKITPTIKSTSNEPLLEISIAGTYNGDTQANALSLFANNPISSWGFELCKEDNTWGDDQTPFGYDWNPNATSWPNGMTLGSICHNNGEKLALYMANEYNHANLATTAGVSSEQTALQTRYRGTATNFVAPGFDYWRSDIDIEGVNDYLSHIGFMQVLDYAIASNSGFRWENCSAGGSKKSLDLLQRQSNQNTNDANFGYAGAEYYRETYYGNSYMINPVQMELTGGSSNGTTVNGWPEYTARTGFLGGLMNGVYSLGNDATLYKNTQRPILRGADVYHILPVCDENHWDGIEFLNTTLTTNPKGSVVLFKPDSAATSSGTFYLKGLVPTTTYTLSYQDRTGSNTSKTGSALMAGGTGLSISGTANVYGSEVIWLSW